MAKQSCPCCGAPVNDAGRYESDGPPTFVTQDGDRYENGAGAASVTHDPVRHEGDAADDLRMRYAEVRSTIAVTGDEGQPAALSHFGAVAEELVRLKQEYPNGYPGSQKWWRHRNGHETGCVMCGAELPTYTRQYGWEDTHPNRMFCSNACRQRAYRQRKVNDAS